MQVSSQRAAPEDVVGGAAGLMIVADRRIHRGHGPICHGTPERQARATLPVSGQARVAAAVSDIRPSAAIPAESSSAPCTEPHHTGWKHARR